MTAKPKDDLGHYMEATARLKAENEERAAAAVEVLVACLDRASKAEATMREVAEELRTFPGELDTLDIFALADRLDPRS